MEILIRMTYYANSRGLNQSGSLYTQPFTLPPDIPGDIILDKLREYRVFNVNTYCTSVDYPLPDISTTFTGPEPYIWEDFTFPPTSSLE